MNKIMCEIRSCEKMIDGKRLISSEIFITENGKRFFTCLPYEVDTSPYGHTQQIRQFEERKRVFNYA